MRIPYVWQLTHSIDFLYVFTDFTIWSTVENGVGIIASSIATLRPLFRKALDMTVRRTTTASTLQRNNPNVLLPRFSGTVMRGDSLRDTAFHCRGLSDYDIEKGVERPPNYRKIAAVSAGDVAVEKPADVYVRWSDQGQDKEASPHRATYDCQSSHSGWSWNSRDPRDSRISRHSRNHGREEWVEDSGNSARSSRTRLVKSRSSRRTTW